MRVLTTQKEGVYPQKAKLWLSYSTLHVLWHIHRHSTFMRFIFTPIQTGCYHLGMCADPGLCLSLHPDVCLLHMCLLLLLFWREKEEVESTQGCVWNTYINNDRLLPVSALILLSMPMHLGACSLCMCYTWGSHCPDI